MVVLMLIVLVLIRGVAAAISLLGGLVMIGMGARWLDHSCRQATGHEQGQRHQPTAEQRGMHNGSRRPGNKRCLRCPDRIDGWSVLR
jgi:hypothetical protein